MIRNESIKKEIQDKFGSLSEFARQAKYNRNNLQTLLQKREPDQDKLREVRSLCRSTDYVTPSTDISPEKRKQLQKAIIAKYETTYMFLKENPQFPQGSTYDLLKGSRVKITALVRSLFAHFAIEL